MEVWCPLFQEDLSDFICPPQLLLPPVCSLAATTLPRGCPPAQGSCLTFPRAGGGPSLCSVGLQVHSLPLARPHYPPVSLMLPIAHPSWNNCRVYRT